MKVLKLIAPFAASAFAVAALAGPAEAAGQNFNVGSGCEIRISGFQDWGKAAASTADNNSGCSSIKTKMNYGGLAYGWTTESALDDQQLCQGRSRLLRLESSLRKVHDRRLELELHLQQQRLLLGYRVMWTRWPSAAVVACSLALVACGGGSEDSSGAEHDEGVEQFRREFEAMVPTASEGQRAALEDGFVSRAEADQLTSEVIRCGAEQGVEIVAEWQTSQGQMQFSYETSGTETYDDCWGRLYDVVERALALQNSLTGDESEALEAGMIDCLAESGIELTSWPSDSDPPADVEAKCYDEVYATVSGG
jgi:hypothetical protein